MVPAACAHAPARLCPCACAHAPVPMRLCLCACACLRRRLRDADLSIYHATYLSRHLSRNATCLSITQRTHLPTYHALTHATYHATHATHATLPTYQSRHLSITHATQSRHCLYGCLCLHTGKPALKATYRAIVRRSEVPVKSHWGNPSSFTLSGAWESLLRRLSTNSLGLTCTLILVGRLSANAVLS